jgi:L-malate glycosyltransferase
MSATTAAPLRVLHLLHTVAHGGVETALLNWIRSFDPAQVQVTMVCFANPGQTEQPFVDAATRQGLPVHRIAWSRRKPMFAAARHLARLVREHRIDIVHAHNVYANLVTLIAKRYAPFKTVTTAYVWHRFDNWRRNALQWFDIRLTRRFDCISAHCESTREAMLRYGIPASDVHTLPCGFETHALRLSAEEREAGRALLGAGPQAQVLVNVARFYPEKAHDFLLDCFAQIVQQRPSARLWIAGVGPLEAQIKAQAQRLGLGDSVRFLGFVVDLPRLLALADLQLHPAHIEGVPLAICEGMAAGLPIVASEVGGLPEILAHGRNGVLVPGLNQHSFVAAVLRLMDEPERARGYGQAARRFIEYDYSLRSAAQRVERTYRELAAC